MTTHVQQIRQQQRELLAELDKQRADHAQHALCLVADPTDPDLIEAVEASASRIEALQKRLALFEAAVNGAQVKDATDKEAALRAAAVGARAQAKTLSDQRKAVAEAIDGTVAALGDLLAQFDSISGQIAQAAHDCTKAVISRDDPRRLDKLREVADLARGRIGHPFGTALADARVGDALAEASANPLGMYKRSTSPRKTVADAVASRDAKLLARLDSILEVAR